MRKKHGKKRRSKVWMLLAVVGMLALWSTDLGEEVVHEAAKEVVRYVQTKRYHLPEDLPESLKELAKKNPEAVEFVRDYASYAGDPEDIDISAEVQAGEIPHFLQWDERWGYETYGSGFLAVTGCGPTCLSMVYCGLTGDASMHPYAMAVRAERDGYYVAGQGSSWSMMSELAADLGLDVREVPGDEERMKAELQAGRPMICIMGPGDFTDQGHFIVLTGLDGKGKVVVHDPNSRKRTKKHWKLGEILSQVRGMWSYGV